MGKAKANGLSGKVRVLYGGGYKRPTKVTTTRLNKSAQTIEAERKRRLDMAGGMYDITNTIIRLIVYFRAEL